MSKSTQLVTACYVAAFVGAHYPARITTSRIARAVDTHPSRVRRIVSSLVKANILSSSRGSSGGITLAREAATITLADIFDAIQTQDILSLGMHNPFEALKDYCFVHPTFDKLYGDLEMKMRDELANTLLTDVYRPWDGGKLQREERSA